jgi:predicted DNA binding CopG/RHH family protein
MKEIPEFQNNDNESEFWEKADSTEYIDWNKSKKAFFPNLKLSSKYISIRLPESMIAELKQKANQKDIPYQALIKLFISEGLEKDAIRK